MLASPLWLLFLIATGVEAYFKSLQRCRSISSATTCMPIWPESYVVEMTTVLWVTLSCCFCPRCWR
jgi:membrane glycosyltransferase